MITFRWPVLLEQLPGRSKDFLLPSKRGIVEGKSVQGYFRSLPPGNGGDCVALCSSTIFGKCYVVTHDLSES
jgi:hypothetical protein